MFKVGLLVQNPLCLLVDVLVLFVLIICGDTFWVLLLKKSFPAKPSANLTYAYICPCVHIDVYMTIFNYTQSKGLNYLCLCTQGV